MNGEKERVAYVDIFRGFAIALMIIVNNHGDWQHVYRIFRHASWHGFLGADIVFPFFLFVMGVSIPFSVRTHLERGETKSAIMMKILRRMLLLVMLGLLLNALPRFDLAAMRIPGVLQRIGLCYAIAGLTYLFLEQRQRWFAAGLILSAYGMVLLFITPDGIGINPLHANTTICFIVDRALFAGHTYAHAPVPGFDPEGLMSTFPAAVSAMAGFFASDYILKTEKNGRKTNAVLLAAGGVLALAGLALSPILPINKNLWTPSYVLFTSGLALIVLTALKVFEERNTCGMWSMPFKWLGLNPLLVYLLSSAAGKILATVPMPSCASNMTLKALVVNRLFMTWMQPHAASFGYALVFLIVWAGFAWILYRKGVVVKV